MKASNKETWKTRIAAAVLAAGLLVPACSWGNNAILLTSFTYESAELPAAFDGFCIVQVSDLHNKMCGDNQYYLISRVKEAEPDIIVITGDLIDSSRFTEDSAATSVADAMCFVEQAVQLAPVYYVSGNHEFCVGSTFSELLEEMNRCGVTILEDASTRLHRDGESITLTGFQNSYDVSSNQAALTKSDDEFVLLLAHNPFLFEKFAQTDADLALTGHAHGGQFRLPLLGGLYAPDQGFLPDYTAGAYVSGDFTMYVSRGIGNSSFPLRLFNRPEVVAVTLRSTAAKAQTETTKGGGKT